MKLFFLLLYIWSFLFEIIHGGRILVVHPLPIWSHAMQFEHLFEILAERGHQVTVYSAYPPKQNISNLRHVEINLESYKKEFASINHFEFIIKGYYGRQDFFGHINDHFLALDHSIGVMRDVFNHSVFQDLLKSTEEYDLIISESFFGQEYLAVLGLKFKAPMIAESSYGTPLHLFEFMGSPYLYSYMPNYKLAYSTKMNFWQRFENVAFGVINNLYQNFYYYPEQDKIMREQFPGKDIPNIKTLMKNISAALIYSDAIFEYPRPQVSNMVYVGGIHLKTTKLPQDLEDIMNIKNSPNGVIYVSFGSLIKPSKMPEAMKTSLVEAFKQIGLTVLWRWEGETDSFPKNIHAKKWLPQQEILAHPNCRLFIGHGGMGSVIEAVNYAIPIVGVPFYNDQPNNLRSVVRLEAGIELSFFNVTKESVIWAATTILNNPSYKSNAIQASIRFNDRLNSPLETAVWWVEYVLRHRGAPHLRTALDDLSWTDFLLLDVLAFVLGVTFIVGFLLMRILRFMKYLISYVIFKKEKFE